MQDAGESDGGGGEKTTRPSEDPTVELRKSCDYCVRLKRACDGKNPCSLCARRHKPCTRSARKKSGPAKGTKYAPRRKRSVIAEWADRTAGARGPLLPHEFPGGGTRGGGGQLPHHDFPLAPIDAAGMRAAGRAYDSGGGLSAHAAAAAAAAAAGGRFGAEALWEEGGPLPGQWRGRRPGEEGHPSSSLPPSSGLPFPWYASGPSPHGEAEGRGGEQGGGGSGGSGGRGFAPPPMGYAPTTAEELSRRQQEHGYHHRVSYSMSSLEAEAAAAVAAGRRPGAPAVPEPYRRRTLDLPPGHWASPSDPFLRSPQQGEAALAQGKRVRLSPPTLGSGAAGGSGGSGGGGGRPVMRPGADYYPSPATSPRAREMAGRPHERPREVDPESSLLSLPPPREPPDPTAGFSFHPAANRPSWRRGSTWESGSPVGGGGGGDGRSVDRNDPRAYHQYPPPQLGSFEYSDRPPSSSSWSSPGGGGGGGRGRGRGASLGGNRRYRNFEREAGEDGQGRGRGVVEWPLPHGGGAGGGGGGDPYHERVELPPPPPPHGFDRHLPLERPLMSGGRQGEGRHDMLLGAPSPSRSEQGYAARGGVGGSADGGAYEHPSGRPRWAGGGGDQMGLPGRGRDHRDFEQEQQRVERGRQDWDGGRRGFWPQGPLRGGVGGGGGGRGGAAAPFQWERERVEEGRRHHPAGEEGDEVALPSSSPRAMHTGSSSSSSYQQQEQQQQQRGGEREESPVLGRDGGEEDRKPDIGRHQTDE